MSGDEAVCADCVGDDALQEFIRENAVSERCDFCGSSGGAPLAVDVSELADHMTECLDRHYSTAENELPWDGAEGGFQGEWWDTYDLLTQEVVVDLPNDSGRLLDALLAALPDRTWCSPDPFRLSPTERLTFSWDSFCRHIKHERRFFFMNGPSPAEEDDPDPLLTSAQILETLNALFEDLGLVSTLHEGTTIYRARYQRRGERLTTPAELGPPPIELSRQSNRMSPPVIVMFYASEEPDVALRETASEPGTFVVAHFETLKDVPILDLTRLPVVPSIFADTDRTAYRSQKIFLHRFARDLARPIARDDRVHVEYIPTQVVTEYVRTTLSAPESEPVMGIRYSSSRRKHCSSLVLFADQGDLEGTKAQPFSKPWIRLVGSKTCRVVRKQIA